MLTKRVKSGENNSKIEELILYISKRLEDDPRYCSTKLNKVLFFADFLRYRKVGRSITEQIYQKLEHGPAPKSLVPIRQRMINERSLALKPRDFWGKVQKVPVACREPDLTKFTPDEMALIDYVIEQLRPMNAANCSEVSHRFIGWELAEIQEDIPYGVALLSHSEEDTQEQALYCDKMQQRAAKWLSATM